jgi:hypothetical protein
MKQAKEYAYQNKSIIIEFILTGLMAGLILYIIIKMYLFPLLALLVATIPGTFLYFQIYAVRILLQFKKYDKHKRLIISEDRTRLTCIHQNNTTIINQANVTQVEIYEQTDLGKFGRYSYMVIYTNTGEQILITKFTVPLLVTDRIMELFLRKVPRVYFKKQFNFIDSKKFPLP